MKKRKHPVWRRIFAGTLAVALTVTGLSWEGIFVDAKKTTLVHNGDFETVVQGDDGTTGLSGWIAKQMSQDNGSLSQGKKDGQDGAYARLETDGAFGMDTATDYLVSVEAGEVYELSYQVRIHGEKSVVTPYLYYYTEEGGAASIPYTSANAVASGKGDWTKKSVKLTMPSDAAKIGLSFVLQAKTEDGSKATADIDDVKVEKVAAGASLLSAKNVTKTATAYAEEEVQLYTAMMANRGTALLDCGFEDGEYAGWNMSGIVPTGEDKVSGDKALKLTKGGYVTAPSVTVESGETYTVKGKLKSGADSQGIFWIHQMTAGGGSVSMWNIGYISELGVSTEGWMDVEFDVKIQEGAALLRLDLQANEGDGASYFDDLTITKKVPVAGQDKDNLLQNGYFEKKLQNWTFADSGAGSHSIVNTGHEKYGQVLQSKLKEASDQVYGWSEEVAVKANYIYTVSYQVKFTPEEKEPTAPYGCIAIIQELNSKGSYTGTPATSQAVNQTNGWKTVTYEYITSADAKTIRMDLMHANIPGTAQWDAVVIKEKGKYTPETLDSKYDHGGTADTKNKANLIANGTFDKGDMSGWNPQEGIKAMATKNTNGGALRFQVKAGRYFQSNAITVQGESRYALTYYVKGENLTNLDLISYLFYTDEKGTVTGWTDFVQYNVTSVAKGQWKKVSIEFATPKLTKGQTLTMGFKTLHTQKCGWQKTNNDKDCNCTVKGTIYLDDISLIRTGAFKDVGEGKTSANSLIYNGTFNRYAANATSVDGWNLNTAWKGFKASIQNKVARSGNALRLEATGHSFIWASDFTVEPGKIYILSYWVRVDKAKGLKFAPYMNDANYGGGFWLDDAVQPVYEKTNGWVKVSGAVSIPDSVGTNQNNPNKMVQLGFQIYEGSGVIYLDDVSMVATKVKSTDGNLDFELDKEVLYNWSFASYNGADATLVASNQVRPGSKGKVSALITSKSRAGESILTGSKIKVKPNTTYEFTYWTKQSGDYQGFSTQFFHQLKKDGVTESMGQTWDGNQMKLVETASISPYWTYQVQGEVGWRQISMSLTTSADCYYIEPRILAKGQNMKLWIDDVTITKCTQNPNLDFETTSKITGAPQNWYMSMGRSFQVTYEADHRVYHSGKTSLHVVKDSLHEKQVIDNAAYMKIEKDAIYEFSFWVNSRNCSPDATLRMDLQLYKADGTRIYKTDGNYELLQGTVTSLNGGKNMSGWKKVLTRSAAPAEAAYATVNFVVTRGYAEFWVDDIFCNIVEDGTDCVVYYEDFHSVDQDGNISDWKLEKNKGKASFTASNGGKITISKGEAYLKNSMKMLMTDYTYTVKGKYHGNADGEAQLRFYDYKGQEYTEERQSVKLSPKGKTFEMTVTAPSNSYSALYIGGKKAGSITLENVTIYLIAKPATSSDWDGFWVWYPENPVDDAVEQYRYFRYEFVLEDDPEYAPLQLTVDDKYALYINGEQIAENWDAGNDSWANVASYDLTEKVKKGRNVIALKCYNLVSEAGVLFDGKFTLKNKNVQVIASGSDVRSSKSANDKTLDWTKVGYNDSGWKLVREYGQPPCSPWGPVFYDSSLYIHNAATVVSTKVPEKVTSGKTLEFEVTLKLDSPIESKFTPVVTIYKRNSLTSVTSAPMELLNYENTLEWPVGEEFTLKASVEIPDYVESGKYQIQMDSNMLLLSGEEVYDNKFLSFEAWASATGRDPITSSIEVVNGTPTLLINGEPQAAHFYNRPDLNVYLQTDAETRLYKSDLELYITYGGSLYKGGCDPIWLEDGSIDYDVFDGVIYETLGNNSNALAMVNIGMFAPTWWMEQNPDEVVTSHDGEKYIKADDVSFASEKFRKEASEVLRQLLQHMKEQSYYNRIYGIKLTAGHTYEWMTWGTGDGYGPDYSKASQEGFKKYLKKVYKTNAALQKAWGNSKVTFENAAAPSWNARSASDKIYMGSVTTGEYPRNMIDWNLYLNDASADLFLHYCKIAKEETDNKLIVGGYNGYLWTNASYDAQGKAHTAFRRVLQSEYVDWVASPISYAERLLGESNVYMTMIDAVEEYGKMYIAEEDNRTCLSNVYAGASWDANWDFQVGQTRTLADTVLQAKRDFANAMINGAGLWQYDMYGGWLDDDQIYDYLSDAKREYEFSVYVDRDMRNEVAVFVGDETYAYMTADSMNPYTVFEPMLFQQRKHLGVMGAGYDTYNMSALLDGKVSGHKVNIILSPFEITEEMQKAMDKYLKVNDQYVVWVYLPGVSDGKSYDVSNIKRATGFDVAVVEKIAGQQVKISQTQSPITAGIEGLVYGTSQASMTSPQTYVKNTQGATVLGTQLDGGQAGLVMKEMGDWTSIYSAAPCLDVKLLRNILKAAGVHIYSESAEDVIYNNNHYVALHSETPGTKTITLPKNASVYDVFEGKFLSMDTNKITYSHGENETHIFRLMTPNTYAVTARLRSGKGTLSAPGLTEVKTGEGYSLKVEAEEGYEVSEVLVNEEVVELTDGTFAVDAVDQNYVIEVKFSKKPELVKVIETIREYIILPWWAFFAGLVVLIALCWIGKRQLDSYRRKKEKEERGL